MSENDAASLQENNQEAEPEVTMQSLMGELLESEGVTIDIPTAGEIRDGIIASLSDNQILVSIGAKSEGIISGKEFDGIPKEILDTFEEGKAIPVYVVTPEDNEGNLILSFVRAVEEQSWLEAEDLLKSGDSFTSEVAGYNKGGLIVPLSTIRGFVPASQLGLSRRFNISGATPEEKFKEFVGESLDVCVIEVDRQRQRLILSERAASNETRDMIRDKVLEDLNPGDVKTGRVTSIADFGAFVNIGGADGLIHLSEMSWDRVEHPSEMVKVGEEVEVKVISIDRDRRRIGLSLRAMQPDPWSKHVKDLKVGQLVEGEITRLTNFGAFAKLNLPGDLEGLVHVSELSDKRIDHPKEVLKSGDVVTLRILKIEDEDHRIGLSLRRVDSPAYADMDWKTLVENYNFEQGDEGGTIGDMVGEISLEQPAEEIVETTVEDAVEIVEETVAEPVEEVVETAEETVAEPVEEVVETEEETVAEPVEEAAETVEETVAEPVEDAVETAEEAAETLEETAAEPVEDAVETAEEAAETVAEWVEEAVETVKEAVVDPVVEAVETAVETVAETIEEIVEEPEEETTESQADDVE
ncbi:MAG: S1 RNA-binding domain-containing protein [Anaerolineaceae bacterium]|jgi:small subunit ribosomal protein S1